jgi:hypothetical protein
MKYLVKFLAIVEIEVRSATCAIQHAQAVLDAFREVTLPSEDYGVTLYRASPDDLSDDLLQHQVALTPLSEER